MVTPHLDRSPSTGNVTELAIRPALPEEAEELSAIAHMAKAWWGYTAQQMATWRDELTFDAASVTCLPIHAAIVNARIAGFYQVELQLPDSVLHHLWVDPAMMRKGIGKALLAHASSLAGHTGAVRLLIDSDPNAEAFYRRYGAVKTAELAAPIDGQPERVRPQLSILLSGG